MVTIFAASFAFITSDSPEVIAWSNFAMGGVAAAAIVGGLLWLCIDRRR